LLVAEKKVLVEPEHLSISISRQCELLGLARSSFYYEIQPETEQNLRLMVMLDKQYTARPFYDVRRMTAWLATQGEIVNPYSTTTRIRLLGSSLVCLLRTQISILTFQDPKISDYTVIEWLKMWQKQRCHLIQKIPNDGTTTYKVSPLLPGGSDTIDPA
jgi:hypothetical protein